MWSPADGAELTSFDERPISGRASPWGLDLHIRRVGDEIVTHLTLGAAHEGAPGRSHGGIGGHQRHVAFEHEVGGAVFGLGHVLRHLADAPARRDLHVAAIGVQLGHAGRKAGSLPLWEGGAALGPDDMARMDPRWRRIGPSAVSAGPGWSVPGEMDEAAIAQVVNEFRAAAVRADQAGFDVVVSARTVAVGAQKLAAVDEPGQDQRAANLLLRARVGLLADGAAEHTQFPQRRRGTFLVRCENRAGKQADEGNGAAGGHGVSGVGIAEHSPP